MQFTPSYSIICLISAFIIELAMSQAAPYEHPWVDQNNVSDIGAGFNLNANHLNYHYENMRIHNNYLVRNSNQSQLEIFDLVGGTLKYKLFVNAQSRVIAYDIPEDDSSKLVVAFSDNTAGIYNLNSDGTASLNISIPLNTTLNPVITAI
jgi:hypothetical protein